MFDIIGSKDVSTKITQKNTFLILHAFSPIWILQQKQAVLFLFIETIKSFISFCISERTAFIGAVLPVMIFQVLLQGNFFLLCTLKFLYCILIKPAKE